MFIPFSPLAETTARDAVEVKLIELMAGKFFQPEDIWPEINGLKSGNFGFSYLGTMLYANGNNPHSLSSNFPRGLVYYNRQSQVAFGLGVFIRPALDPAAPNFHIIAPQGNWLGEVRAFCANLQATFPTANFYVRHLPKGQVLSSEMRQALGVEDMPENISLRQINIMSGGFEHITTNPWLAAAPQEDEQENRGRIFVLDRILKDRPAQYNLRDWAGSFLSPETIARFEDGQARVAKAKPEDREAAQAELANMVPDGYKDVYRPEKLWLALKRFQNFLDRNHLEYILQPYGEEQRGAAEKIVNGHFADLRDAVGSTPEDYRNLINAKPALIPGIHMFVGVLRKLKDNSRSLPVSFFAFEEINRPGAQRMAGGYATITRRNIVNLEPLLDIPASPADKSTAHEELAKGASAIAVYAMNRVMRELNSRGIKVIDLGGSETRNLAEGKEHMGGQPRETYWVVKSAKSASVAELAVVK